MDQRRSLTLFALLFSIAYALNVIWEYLHYPLYATHPLPRLACALITAFFDALAVVGIYLVVASNDGLDWEFDSKNLLLALGASLLLALIVEALALVFGWWSYTPSMPVLPLVASGLSPILQMLLLPITTFWLARAALGKAASRRQ